MGKTDIRYYKSTTGENYPIPATIVQREHGFTLRHQTAKHQSVFYQFNTSEFLNTDHAFQAAVNLARYLLENNLMALGLQHGHRHVVVTDTHMLTYLFCEKKGKFVLYRKGILRIKKDGMLDYYVNQLADKREASIDVYRRDLIRNLPVLVKRVMKSDGSEYSQSFPSC